MAKVNKLTTAEDQIIQDLTPPEQQLPQLDFDLEKFAEALDKMPEEDKVYVQVRQAMSIVSMINVVEAHVVGLNKKLTECFPNVPEETIKIIIARMNDIKVDAIKELSMGFIKNFLTVEGKEISLELPKGVAPPQVKEMDPLVYNRVCIGIIYSLSIQIETCKKWLEDNRKEFDEKIPDEIKSIIGSTDKTNNFINEYLEKKANDPSVPEEARVSIRTTLRYSNYAVTLEPLMESLKAQCQKNKNLVSLVHNFRNKSADITVQAYKCCKSIGITYPHELICNVEKKLFPGQYPKFEYLFSFLIARYIKFKADSFNKYEKIFLTQLFSNIVQIMRSPDDPEKDNCKELKEKMKPHIKEVLDYVVAHSILR